LSYIVVNPHEAGDVLEAGHLLEAVVAREQMEFERFTLVGRQMS
jgi:hypothetical protein